MDLASIDYLEFGKMNGRWLSLKGTQIISMSGYCIIPNRLADHQWVQLFAAVTVRNPGLALLGCMKWSRTVKSIVPDDLGYKT